jgi:hypothetical protein
MEIGAVSWSCKHVEKLGPSASPEPGEARFWRRTVPGSGLVCLDINWGENRACNRWLGYIAWGIMVPRAAVEALLGGRSRRKPGPGAERTYDHDAFIAAAGIVLGRGVPDTKQVFFDQVRAQIPRGKKLPPDDDNTTLNRVVGRLYNAAKSGKKA